MNVFFKTSLAIMASVAISLTMADNLHAQSATVGSGNGDPGQSVIIPVGFVAGGDIAGVELTISFATGVFSAVSVNCGVQTVGSEFPQCSNANAATGSVKVVLASFSGPFVSGKLADITFTIDGSATPGDVPLNITVNSLSNSLGGAPDPSVLAVTPGAITVNAPPQPEFSSNPAAGGGTEFVFGPVAQNGALASQNLTITNTGVGTLSGECTEGADAGDVFTVTNGAYSAGAGLNDTVTVACNSAGAIATHTGSMSCTHNGGNVASPVEYQFSCQITDGPKAAFSSSNPAAGGAINLAVGEAGDPNPSQSLTITNSGDATTTLTGSCAVSGDSQITVSSTAQFNILQGAAGVQRTVTCDASVQGDYTGTLSCTHNGSNASPVEYAVSCTVPEAGSAEFRSVPAPGPIVIGDDVVVGDTDPTRTLTFYNDADPGDQLLGVVCDLSGDSEISVSPTGTLDILIGPQTSTPVTFTCDTAIAGDFNATYSCFHQSAGVDQPVGDLPNAVYNLSCEVREPATQVVPTVPDGTTQIVSVTIGGTGSFSVGFAENFGDNPAPDPYDAFIQGCEISGTDAGIFSITSPNSFPVEIPTDSTVNVTVEGTDDQSKESYSAALDCVYADTSDSCRIPVVMDATTGIDVCGRSVSYPIVMNVGGGDARFTVLKEFTDGNPGEVTVDLDCDSGLLLDQEKTITEDGIGVTFVVTDFNSGELNCNVTERPLAGYSTEYNSAGSDSASTDSGDSVDGCFYTLIDGGDENSCVITNSPDDVDVVITKEWLYPGSADSTSVSDDFTFVLYCSDASIVGGSKIGGYYEELTDSPSAYLDSCAYSYGDKPKSASYDEYCKTLYGSGNKTFKEKVNPYVWPGGSCYVEEVDVDPSVEVDNGCGSLEVSVGSGDSCTITNTVFFEGIPTLSQYGMALMALLMLGMGFVAVRRIV